MSINILYTDFCVVPLIAEHYAECVNVIPATAHQCHSKIQTFPKHCYLGSLLGNVVTK